MRLLIAEDEKDLADALCVLFEKNQFSVDTVGDGFSAYEYASSGEYDAIILDIMMPKVDGLKVLRVIRAMEKQHDVPQEKRARILMTTALADLDYVDQAFKLGADGYAAKPIDTDKITEVIRNMGLIGEKLEAHPTDTVEQ